MSEVSDLVVKNGICKPGLTAEAEEIARSLKDHINALSKKAPLNANAVLGACIHLCGVMILSQSWTVTVAKGNAQVANAKIARTVAHSIDPTMELPAEVLSKSEVPW